MSKYKVILFDLWDTLVKIPNLNILINETKDILGKDRYFKMMDHFVKWHTSNKPQKEFIENLNKEISIKEQELPVIEEFIAPKTYEKFPETDEVLKSLKNNGLRLILVTNSPPPSKKACERLNISHFFDRTVFSCDIGILKPNKQIFTYAVKNLGIDPHEALMVGNSLEKDVEGAINAGLDGILIDRKGVSEYKNKITDLKELLLMTKK